MTLRGKRMNGDELCLVLFTVCESVFAVTPSICCCCVSPFWESSAPGRSMTGAWAWCSMVHLASRPTFVGTSAYPVFNCSLSTFSSEPPQEYGTDQDKFREQEMENKIEKLNKKIKRRQERCRRRGLQRWWLCLSFSALGPNATTIRRSAQ